MCVVSGKDTSFWRDAWLGDTSLYEVFSRLFEICNNQDSTVRELADSGWAFSFRRWLQPELQQQASNLRSALVTIALGEGRDHPKWKFTRNGVFIVKSLYNKMSSSGPHTTFKHLWKAKIH